MPPRTAQGVVVRATTFGEADRLVTLYTREVGLLRGVAKNAKKSLRRFGGRLEPFSRVEARYFEREGAALVRFEAFEALHVPVRLAEDVRSLGTAGALLELLVVLSAEHQPHPELYDLLEAALDRIEQGRASASLRPSFELRALARLGHAPGAHRCARCRRPIDPTEGGLAFSADRGGILCPSCGGTAEEEVTAVSGEVARVMAASWEPEASVPLEPEWSDALSEGLETILRDYLLRHLEVRLRSDRFLEGIPS